MTAKKLPKEKPCTCGLSECVTELKQVQARNAEICGWNAEESREEFGKVKTTLFYILAGVCVQIAVSLILLYHVTTGGAGCATHP